MFYGLDRENQLDLRFFGGSDGQLLWSMKEALSAGMALYVDFGNFSADQGSDLVLLKTEYRAGEAHSGLLDAYREDTLVQQLSVRRGSDGSISWEQDRNATITRRYVSPLETLPWNDFVVATTGVIDILQPIGNIAASPCEDLFISTVDSRSTERSRAFGLLSPQYFSSGRVKASVLEGCGGEEVATIVRESEYGVPLAYAVGDVSGDGLMDVAAAVPAPENAVRLDIAGIDGSRKWDQLLPGSSLRVSGVPLLASSPNDLIIVAETVVDVDAGTSTFATFARRGWDGAHLWSIDRELVPHRLGDVNGDGTQELLVTDSVDPASATTISAASGATLEPVWGPTPINKEVDGATVESKCVCPALADFDGDGVEDLGIRRSIDYDGSSISEFSAVRGRDGSQLWAHQTDWNAARPIPNRADLNANGTTDVSSFDFDVGPDGTMYFYEGASLSPLWSIAVLGSWSYTDVMGADLTAGHESETVLYHVPVVEGTVETIHAYEGTTLLWEARLPLD